MTLALVSTLMLCCKERSPGAKPAPERAAKPGQTLAAKKVQGPAQASPARAAAPAKCKDNTVVDLSSSKEHNCALTACGRVYCWGANKYGQLGDGTTTNRSSPVLVQGLEPVVQIETNAYATGARTADGRVFYFGICQDDQCGASGRTSVSTPHQIPGVKDAANIVVGDEFGCAIKAGGAVACWGKTPGSKEGQVKARPVGGLSSVASLSAGHGVLCALTTKRKVLCLGKNIWHYFEGGSDKDYKEVISRPVELKKLAGATQIDAAWSSLCALTRDRRLRCFREFGKNTAPTNMGRRTDVVRAGLFQHCILTRKGQVGCWGESVPRAGGRLVESRKQALPVPGLVGVKDLGVGTQHACVLLTNGQVRCWGTGGSGERGDSATLLRLRPVKVKGVSGVTAIHAVTHSVCAVEQGGAVKCWGSLGCAVAHPVKVPLLGRPAELVGDGSHCGRRSKGKTRCWSVGKEGVEMEEEEELPLQNIRSLDMGTDHTCAVTSKGKVRCWGENEYGQLSKEPADEETVLVAGVRDTREVSAGEYHTCARTGAGAVYCWGSMMTALNSKMPVRRIRGIKDAVQLASGDNYTCALTRKKQVICFGTQGYGDDFLNSMKPKTIPELRGVEKITANGHNTCGVRRGKLLCWGENGEGQLGDGTQKERARPVVADLPFAVKDVTTSAYTTCVVDHKGDVWCWGANNAGQLGDGWRPVCGKPNAVKFP